MSAPTDEFKDSFKYFKRRKPPPDLSGVIDFRRFESEKQIQQVQLQHQDKTCFNLCTKYGLKPLPDWKVFSLSNLPGFMFIQDPFLPGCQRFWIKRCLQDFPQKPNICNLDAHMTLTEDDSVWDMAQSKSSAASSKNSGEGKSLLQQLRWVTFGYHHNWDTKVYQEDHHSPFPPDLAGMTELIATALGYGTYRAQAAIVNYYHLDSALGGHTDHSEFDLGMPIISYSFGQSAIFLLGGKTKDQRPTALFLHSGDIIIMGGPSRLAYHAVPRVLPSKDGPLPACLEQIPETLPDVKVPGKKAAPLSASVGTKYTLCSKQMDQASDLCIHSCGMGNMETRSIQTCSCGQSDRKNDDVLQHPNTCQPTLTLNSNDSEKSFLGKKRGIELTSEIDSEGMRTLAGAKIVCKEQRDCMAGECSRTSTSSVLPGKSETSEGDENTFSINAELINLCCKEIWNPFANYLRDSRINVSVRQVLKAGERFPDAVREETGH